MTRADGFGPDVVQAGQVLHRSKTPVRVEVDGTPVVTVRPRGADGAAMRLDDLEKVMLYVRGMVVGTIAPYLRR
ncbi:MAG: hypothetical protein M0Z42_04260 [Actinomycetota bacterium]|nr:hypothetical protein [Actinomycetota bacterium]